MKTDYVGLGSKKSS